MAETDALDGLMGTADAAPAPGTAPVAATPAPVDTSPLDGLMGGQTRTPSGRPAPAAAVRKPGKQTRYTQSPVTPSDTDEYAAMPWGEVGKRAVQSALPSTWGAIKAVGHALTSPKETFGAVGDLAEGLKSKAVGAIGLPQDAAAKAKDESLVDALFKHYGDTYGTSAGFKKALATDPASIAMDASTLFGGAGAGAKAAGLTKLASGLGTASRITDPIYGAVKAAKAVATPAVWTGRKLAGLTSGAHPEFLKAAALAGAGENAENRAAFLRHFRGAASPNETLQAVSDAYSQLKNQTLEGLRNDKRLSYANAPGAMPFNDIDAAYNAAVAAHSAPGAPASWKADKMAALEKAKEWIDYHKANPSMQTMEKFDDLRAEIGDLGFANNDPRIKQAVQPIYDAIRKTMQKVSPEYTDVLERTSAAQREFKDMARTLGVNAFNNGTAMSPTLIARQIRQAVTSGGKDMLDRISKVDPKIPYMLAGIATHEMSPHGLRAVGHGLGLTGGLAGLTAFAASPHAWLPAVGGAAAGYLASSPKVHGALNYGYGSLDRYARNPIGKAAYQVGRGEELQDAGPSDNQFADASLPRNARNLNYGNIKDGQFAKAQPGYAGSDGTFARFNTPEAGAAAAKTLIRNYIRMGRDTPDKIAANWVAGGENTDEDRAQHAAAIADALGINHDSKIDHLDARAINAIFHAIARREGSDVPEPEGERAERARGGKVKIDHAAEAATLIRRAERTKNGLGKATEAMLGLSDNHIASALAVANESI